jgi:hypothetical protein
MMNLPYIRFCSILYKISLKSCVRFCIQRGRELRTGQGVLVALPKEAHPDQLDVRRRVRAQLLLWLLLWLWLCATRRRASSTASGVLNLKFTGLTQNLGQL